MDIAILGWCYLSAGLAGARRRYLLGGFYCLYSFYSSYRPYLL